VFFHCFGVWNVSSTREWDFTAQQFWWSWVFAHSEGTLLTMQCKLTLTNLICPFYTTKEMPHVTVTITKNALLAVIARYRAEPSWYIQLNYQLNMFLKISGGGLPGCSPPNCGISWKDLSASLRNKSCKSLGLVQSDQWGLATQTGQ